MSAEKRLIHAKTLRANQTEAEQRLWYHLRAHRFMDLKFKRQNPMGRFIVDFVCVERQLIIEINGGQHAGQTEYDQHRDAGCATKAIRYCGFGTTKSCTNWKECWNRFGTLSPSPPAPRPQAGEGSRTSARDL